MVHDAGVMPTLELLGKIAGIEEIPVETGEPEREQLSFWAEFLYGGVLVHIFRIILYPMVVLGLGWIGYLAANSLSEYVRSRNVNRRLRLVEPLLEGLGPEVRRSIYHALDYGFKQRDFSNARDILLEMRDTNSSLKDFIINMNEHPEKRSRHMAKAMELVDDLYNCPRSDRLDGGAKSTTRRLIRVLDALASQ